MILEYNCGSALTVNKVLAACSCFLRNAASLFPTASGIAPTTAVTEHARKESSAGPGRRSGAAAKGKDAPKGASASKNFSFYAPAKHNIIPFISFAVHMGCFVV